MSPQRRDVLRNAGTALSGGCLARIGAATETWTGEGTSSTTTDASESEASGTSETSEPAVTVESFDLNFSLAPGERRTWAFEFDTETTLTYDLIVRWGPIDPGVDILLFASEEEFQAYLNEYRARYIAAGSVFGKANINVRSLTVPAGSYYLAADNNAWTDGFADSLDGTTNQVDDATEVPSDSSDGSDTLGLDFEFTATQ